MKIVGNIIEKIYNRGLSDELIEIWETGHFNSDSYHVKNILIPDESYWDSNNEVTPPSFVIHFKKHIIHANQYFFTSTHLSDRYPNSWKGYGSMDNETWFELSTIDEDHQFKDLAHTTLSFPLKDSAFSWIKFTFTKTQHGNCTVYLQQFDVSGVAFPITMPTCKSTFRTRCSLLFYLLILK